MIIEIKRQKSIKALVISALLIIVAILCINGVEDFYHPIQKTLNRVEFERIRLEIPKAKSLWRKANISDYEFTVFVFMPPDCAYYATISVRNNQVDSVMKMNPDSMYKTLIPQLLVDKESWEKWDKDCAYKNILIPQMFDKVERAVTQLKPSQWALRVRFDSQYGFVTYFRQDDCYFGGIDCSMSYTFDNFRPLTNNFISK